MSARPRIGMRLIVISITIAIVVAAVLAVGLAAERNTRRALTHEAEARLLLEARNLALTGAGALLSELPELTLHPVVRELSESRPELAFAVVLDHRGVVQGHRDARSLGKPWEAPRGLAGALSAARMRPGERLEANRELLVASVPVTSAAGQHLGTVAIGLRRAYVEQAVAAARRQQLLLVLVVLVLGVAAAFLLLGVLLRPIAVLRAGLERIGRGDLDTPIAVRDRTELGLLAETVNTMTGQLKLAQRDIVEKERLAREVELARDIQQRLLPAGARTFGEFTLRGAHRAAAEVGGDYYDVLPLADGRVAIAIADVAGKGLGGCLVMSMLAASLRAMRQEHHSPRELLVALEAQLVETLKPGEFVTMFYGILDLGRGELVWASAGHTPLLLWREAKLACEWHPTRGIPLGAVRGGMLRGTLDDHTLTLAPGDLLFQFTDGYSEAHSDAGEEFGFDRIEQAVAGNAGAGPEAVIAALSHALERWSGGRAPEDDLTMLVLSRAADAAAPAQPPGALERTDPLAVLAAAEANGHALSMASSLEALEALGPWISALPEVGALPEERRILIETALHELCANVVEHGSGEDAAARLDLWWLPAGAPVSDGCFVMRDRGFPFRPGRRRPFDPAHHVGWHRGRGLGLDIVHRVVREAVFRPGTTAGNLTLLAFDPAGMRLEGKEQRHG